MPYLTAQRTTLDPTLIPDCFHSLYFHYTINFFYVSSSALSLFSDFFQPKHALIKKKIDFFLNAFSMFCFVNGKFLFGPHEVRIFFGAWVEIGPKNDHAGFANVFLLRRGKIVFDSETWFGSWNDRKKVTNHKNNFSICWQTWPPCEWKQEFFFFQIILDLNFNTSFVTYSESLQLFLSPCRSFM